MSNQPKPCPNPKCKSVAVAATYPYHGWSYVYCGRCDTRGPSVKCDDPSDDVEVTMAKAEAAWNALPREGDPAPATTEELAGSELKPCPSCGPKNQELYITTEPDGAFIVCAGCAMRGPATRSREPAIQRWGTLPRKGDPAPATTDVLIYPFDGMANRVFRFQTIVNGAGNIPSVDAAMLKLLYRELLGDSDESALATFDADIDAYLGLKPKEQSNGE